MRVLLLTAVLCAAPAAPAEAARGLLRVVQDDATLLGPGRERALDEMRAAGVDVVRVNLVWRRIDREGWPPVDDLVRAATARGLRVLATPTTPAPDRFARRVPGVRPGTWRPDPRGFAAFVAAAAARYGSQVTWWSLVNEPNNGNWLTPQQQDGRRLSPGIYRRLVRAAMPVLPAGSVLLGEQLGVGRAGGDALASIRPRTFLRDFLCLDARDRPRRGCGRFAPLDFAGWAVHPYSSPRGAFVPPVHRDTLTPGTLRRLLPTLDAGRRHGRLARRVDLWATEGGVQTNPPDRLFGAPPARQAAILNQTEALLWRTPRVRAWGQYLWVDEPRRASFQSGLRFVDGRAKPALAAYRLPLDARRLSPGRVRVWVRRRVTLSTGHRLEPGTTVVRTRARRLRARAGGLRSRTVSVP